MDTRALEGVEIQPELQLLKFVYELHPEQAPLLPIVQKMHACWHEDPARIMAFFLRDNKHLMPYARILLGLDVLDWSEKMWASAVETDSFAQFAIMVMASGTSDPPRQPPAGLCEAIEDEKYEIAAGYMTFYGSTAAGGICDRWTRLYWELYQNGGQRQIATAQFINGIMKRFAGRVWERDKPRLAEKLTVKAPLDECKRYLDGEATNFADPGPHALALYVLKHWEAYPADFPESKRDSQEAKQLHVVAGNYLSARIMGSGADPLRARGLLTLTTDMSSIFNLDRKKIAQQIVADSPTPMLIQEVMQDLERLDIGV